MIQEPFIQHLIAKYKTPAFTDAVGTGSIFGPILACAVALPYEYYNPEVDDSKKLPHKTIYRLAPILKTKMIWAVGVVSAEELLVIKNNLKGEHIAMARAVGAIQKKIAIDVVFVDGKFTLPKTGIQSYAIIRGDSCSFGIAAASIIAKNERDQQMITKYNNIYPGYDLIHCKGYKSPKHRSAILNLGITEEHRNYLPYVKKLLGKI